MKIPYKWIREFVDLRLSAQHAADRLTNAGIEVSSVTPLAPPELAGVVVAEIEAIERDLGESRGHRLTLCRVSTGRERFSVVCGAPNVAVGVRTALAPPGAVLPAGPGETGGRKVATVKIRGVESQGILCSERELGLGPEHERGVLILGPEAPVGRDLVAYLGLDDSVLEIEITPNRPDCLSVVGVARELGALTGVRFRPPTARVRESREPARGLARVRIADPALCARYAARIVSGVRVGPSPAWLAARLQAVGLRPISNVVDVTNYVLWELGHPLHAFDYDTIAEHTIIVRRARAGEILRTLDGQARTLTDAMLVIADPQRAIALAGVIGGADTEVREGTTRVLLEAAYFAPASVRRTARALGLATDAAYRFERGADIEALATALDRAAQLIADVAGGQIARGRVDAYPRRRQARRVRLRMERLERVLGVAPPRPAAKKILQSLGLPTRDRGRDLEVDVPSFRRDIAIEDDLVEEVIRVWGYDKIPSTLPGGGISLVQIPASLRQERAVRAALVGAGLHEAITYSFTDATHAMPLVPPGDTGIIRIKNPLSEDAALLRAHPLDGLLRAVSANLRHRQANVGLFEIGRTYDLGADGLREPRWAVVALTGARADAAWSRAAEPVDVYDVKGIAELVLDALGIVVTAREGGRLGGFESDCHGSLVTRDGTVVAEFGEVGAAVRVAYDIEPAVFATALSLDVLAAQPAAVAAYQPLPRFPAVQRDLAFVADAGRDLTAAEIEATIHREAGPLLRDLILFDVFTFEDGRRSLAWRLTFQADDRTLTDDEVNAIHERIAQRVAEQFGITWRRA